MADGLWSEDDHDRLLLAISHMLFYATAICYQP
jgi:hypothetical protein